MTDKKTTSQILHKSTEGFCCFGPYVKKNLVAAIILSDGMQKDVKRHAGFSGLASGYAVSGCLYVAFIFENYQKSLCGTADGNQLILSVIADKAKLVAGKKNILEQVTKPGFWAPGKTECMMGFKPIDEYPGNNS